MASLAWTVRVSTSVADQHAYALASEQRYGISRAVLEDSVHVAHVVAGSRRSRADDEPVIRGMAPRGGPNHKWATPAQGPTRYLSQTDTLTYTFVIDPNVSATYDLGMGNTLYIPAHTSGHLAVAALLAR